MNNGTQLINNVAVIGIGLIGGSMALALKEKNIAGRIYGVDQNEAHCKKALELKLVDEISSLEKAVAIAELIILAVPVNIADALLPQILELTDKQVVMDVGSTKNAICISAKNSINSKRFV